MMESDLSTRIEFLETMRYHIQSTVDFLDKVLETVQNKEDGNETIHIDDDYSDFNLPMLDKNGDIETRIGNAIINYEATNGENLIDNKNSKLYLICEGVEKCSKMIRIGDNFSSRAFRNVSFGKHTYLMGKSEVCRFLCAPGGIKGVYWNRLEKTAFEFGFDLQDDGYYFTGKNLEYFNRVAKIITFVELGDIEVLMLEQGRNNGKSKKDGKVTNTSPYTVYVVDSSWNQLIIRTDGFAVMGHYRLQACGRGLIDRKLIWINAFEKHGYKRHPKARIIH